MSSDTKVPVLVIQRANHPLSEAWWLGYETGDRLRIWAGGASDLALQGLIAAERRRTSNLVIDDRR